MAKYDFGNFVAGFGKGLIDALETNRKLEEQRRRWEEELSLQKRQLTLLDAFRKAQIENEKAQIENQTKRTNAEIESTSAELLHKFTPITPGIYGGVPSGAVSGEQLQKQFPTIGSIFNQGLYYLPTTKPIDPYTNPYIANVNGKPVQRFYNTLTGKWEDIGEVYRQTEDITPPILNESKIASEIGEIDKYNELYKNFANDQSVIEIPKNNEMIKVDKKMWKVMAEEPLKKAMTKVGLTENGGIIGLMWKNMNEVINNNKDFKKLNEKDKALKKREILKSQLDFLKSKGILTPDQELVLDRYILVKTR